MLGKDSREIKLRKLLIVDAPLMLEWMHDPDVVADMQADFMSKTLQDCIDFIEKSAEDKQNLHLAIVDENDIYQGTVSLKQIQDDSAEFAIVMRKNAMKTGRAQRAMQDILQIGFKKLQLQRIYWCSSPHNQRAIRFYDKNDYKRVDRCQLEIVGYTKSQIDSLIWYQIERESSVPMEDY